MLRCKTYSVYAIDSTKLLRVISNHTEKETNKL